LDRKFKIVPELGPLALPEEALAVAGWPDARGAVMLIGHQPWLGQLASLLLTGVAKDLTIKKSNAWWIARRQRDQGNELYLRAVLAPDFFLD
jgi:phosphohistidine phosphatase